MNRNLISPIITAIVASILFLSSCKKDSETAPKPTLKDFKYGRTVDAIMSNSGSNDALSGYVTVDENNKAMLQTEAGLMTGTAQGSGEEYTFTFSEATGIFKDVTGLKGTINNQSELTVTGTNTDGTAVTLRGNANLQTTSGFEKLQKVPVLFTHNEAKQLATVTINAETFSGLNAHYGGGYCSDTYNLYMNIPVILDTAHSKIFCHSGVLKGLDGKPLPFTDCSVIRFVLDKDTKYDYTVTWSDGTSSSGSFTTRNSGMPLPICLKYGQGGSVGGGSCNNPIDNVKIGSQTTSISSVDCIQEDKIYEMDAELSNDDDIIVRFNNSIPGTQKYTIINGYNTTVLQANQATIYTSSDKTGLEYISTGSGNLTVSVINGKTQVDFCNVAVKTEDGSNTTIVSGKFRCF